MGYTAWDSISYGESEPLTPFTKICESSNLNDIIKFIDENESNYGVIFVCGIDGEILFDTTIKIYESPDGKTIFERNMLSNKRNLKN